ncbi:MAG: hypothetical protein DRJ50_15155 [Actinobacteria bacterium]|nr:MAG: hypothetical protein DRJ50_15155 [Actinomycetota bacterium]
MAYDSLDASILESGPLRPRTRLPFGFRRPEDPPDTLGRSTSTRPEGLQALDSASVCEVVGTPCDHSAFPDGAAGPSF